MRRMLTTLGTVFVVSALLLPAALPAGAAGKIASLQATIDTTSPWSPTPSPDPSGIAWWPEKGHLVVADGEVEEIINGITHYAGANIYEATPGGALVSTSTTYPDYSREPTDIATNGSTVYVIDDNLDQVFVIDIGPDGELNTPDDIRTSFSTRAFNSHDPEGLAYGNGALWVSDGVNNQVYRVDPGSNALFDGVDDGYSCFDTSVLGMRDPEGVTVDPATGNLFIISRTDREVAKATTDGRLVNLINLAGLLPFTTQTVNPAGVAMAPASDDPSRSDLYISDRAVDNNTDPNEVDGKIWEIRLSDPTTNVQPVVSGPGGQVVVEGEPIVRQVTAHDPNDDPITYSATGLPPGLSIDPATGLITGTIAPGAAAASPYASTLRASDGTLTGSRNASWTVSATGTFNTPPSLTNPGDQSAVEGQPVDLEVTATDPDAGNVMMFSAQGLPPGLWMDCVTGRIAGAVTPGAAAGNPYQVRVSVSDQVVPGSETFRSKWGAETFTWFVSPGGPNQPPVVTNPGDQTNTDGDAVSLQIQASDPDLNVLTYSATELPPGLSIDPSTGLIGGTIGGPEGSPYTVEVSASDGQETDAEVFLWTVNPDLPPAAPSGLAIGADSGGLRLDWADNVEPDLGGYNVYRIEGGAPVRLNGSPLTTSDYYDQAAPPGQTSTYDVTAVDARGHESGPVTESAFRGKIAFRSSSTASVNSAKTISVPRPTGVQAGDVLLAAISVGGAPTSVTPPSGWSLIRQDASGTSLKQYVFVKAAGAAEPASYTWGFPAKFGMAAGILAYSGASTPVDSVGGQVNARSTSIIAPSLEAGASNELLVGFFGTATNTAITPAAGMIERAERVSNGSKKTTLEAADDALDAAGATLARTALASASAVNIGQAIVLRPAP